MHAHIQTTDTCTYEYIHSSVYICIYTYNICFPPNSKVWGSLHAPGWMGLSWGPAVPDGWHADWSWARNTWVQADWAPGWMGGTRMGACGAGWVARGAGARVDRRDQVSGTRMGMGGVRSKLGGTIGAAWPVR